MQVGNMQINPRDKVRGFVETGSYADALKLRAPILACCGAKPGPTLTVIAGEHGRELNGIEAIRRVFEELDPQTLAGTFLAAPVANPYSVRLRQQDYPDELGRYFGHIKNTNLNRVWPGKADGNPMEQMAYAIWNAIVKDADCVIDLHGWSGLSMGMVWADERDAELARLFGYRLFMVSQYAGKSNGMVDVTCYEHGIPNVTAELPPQNVLDESGVGMGTRGIRNIMIHLGMIEGEMEFPEQQLRITPESVEHDLKAEHPGLLVPMLQKDTMVKRGDLIAVLVSLETLEVVQEIRSPAEALLYNVGIHRLEALANTSIATGGETVALVKEVEIVQR